MHIKFPCLLYIHARAGEKFQIAREKVVVSVTTVTHKVAPMVSDRIRNGLSTDITSAPWLTVFRQRLEDSTVSTLLQRNLILLTDLAAN